MGGGVGGTGEIEGGESILFYFSQPVHSPVIVDGICLWAGVLGSTDAGAMSHLL